MTLEKDSTHVLKVIEELSSLKKDSLDRLIADVVKLQICTENPQNPRWITSRQSALTGPILLPVTFDVCKSSWFLVTKFFWLLILKLSRDLSGHVSNFWELAGDFFEQCSSFVAERFRFLFAKLFWFLVAERAASLAILPTDLIDEQVRGNTMFFVYAFYAKFNYIPPFVIQHYFPGAVLLYEKHQYSGRNEILQCLLRFREQVPEV